MTLPARFCADGKEAEEVLMLAFTLCLGTLLQDPPGEQAQVAVPRLEYHDIPGGRGFTAGLLGPGAVVQVMRVEPSGWAAIAPPAGSYCWIDQGAVQPDEEGGPFGLIIAPEATARVGSQGARMPGPPRYRLRQGDRVRLVDLPPLAVGGRKWRAIEPPRGVVYYVPADSLRLEGGQRAWRRYQNPKRQRRCGPRSPAT